MITIRDETGERSMTREELTALIADDRVLPSTQVMSEELFHDQRWRELGTTVFYAASRADVSSGARPAQTTEVTSDDHERATARAVKWGCLGILGVVAVVIFWVSWPSNKPANSPQLAKKIATLREVDRDLSAHWVTFGGGVIERSVVEGHLSSDGTIHYATVSLYFAAVPTDFVTTLEYICESVHDVYKSDVYLRAYRRTATGRDWREIASSEWSNSTSRVTTRLH